MLRLQGAKGDAVAEPAAERLETALARRLREVSATAPVTERELRTLAEKGDAWERTLAGLLAASERRLTALSGDPRSSLATVAEELARAERLRTERAELHDLLLQLDARARTLRTGWLAGQARSAGRGA
jgi:predicted aminopeptidase